MKAIICAIFILIFLIAFCCRTNFDDKLFRDGYDTVRTEKWYYDDGQISKWKLYLTDTSGRFQFYYPNGKLMKVQGFTRDSVESGIYMYFNEYGIVLDSGNIVNNDFHDRRIEYYENGKAKKGAIYNMGEIRGSWLY